jgi:hypothetical protein
MFQILGRFGSYLLANYGALAAGYFVADSINNLSGSEPSGKGLVGTVQKVTGLSRWQSFAIGGLIIYGLFYYFANRKK